MADVPMVFILVGIAAYTMLAGADFGTGLWTLLAGPGRTGRPAARDHARHAMGPVWEANHVWLIFVLVVCWTAYPVAFGSITSTLAVPLFIAAIGIVLRGASYAHSVDTVREIVNVLLLRGNIGREGAGPCPVRGHSNVQGNRTCGIDHRPRKEFLDRLAEVCGIDPPREHGLGTVPTIEAMRRGDVQVFVALGGNFALATPDQPYTYEGLRNCELTVQVSTKLNRSHLVHGKRALILPCLGRTEKDRQAGGEQGITVEDAMSMVHISVGMKEPASRQLRSECAILAGLAKATLPRSSTPWQDYADDYDRIRDTMAQVLDGFEEFNTRARHPHGFRIHQPARERVFHTPSGRAEFSVAPLPDDLDPGNGRLILTTIRSHDQFNTTIYSNDDRYRGLKGLRTVIFMNADDMRARGIEQFGLVDVTSFSKDGSERGVYGYRAVSYEIPPGCAAGYMPELNVLCGIADVSTQSEQPVTKHLVVEVTPATGTASQEKEMTWS
jgi:molybdopterin-dependent oxidoreductase alpha subunit